jgi:ABC-2 type transport system permease protein
VRQAVAPITAARGYVLLRDLGRVAHQLRYDLLAVWRNRQSRFFTLFLPIIFLVIFVGIFGNDLQQTGPHQTVKTSTFYVPGIGALAVIAAAFTNLVISTVTQRESGVLKRRRSTPVPAWVLIAGRALTAVVVAAAVVTVLIVIGVVGYGVHLRAGAIPAIALAVVVGTICFACLAYAVTTVIESADAAQPVTQAIILPLMFISGVFIPDPTLPGWMRTLANVFPVRHLARALYAAFDPTKHGAAIAGPHLLALLAWGAAGLAFALRRFSWLPKAAEG